MNWRRLLVGIIVVALLLGVGAFVYWRFFNPQQSVTETTAETAATPDAEARLDSIAVATGAGSVSAEGQITPLRQARLAFAGSGQVIEIAAAEGTMVKAGDPILRLDTADQETALTQAQAGLAQAQANLATAQAALEAAQTGAAAAEVGVRAAEAQLALTRAEARPEEVALQEASVALADARIAQAAAAQGLVLEGPTQAQIQAAEAELQAAEAQALPARLRLEQLRQQDEPDAEELAQAEREYAAALAGIEAARAAVEELQQGATAAQRQAAGSGVTAVTAQRDAAQAELDLLLAGNQAEQIAIAEAGVSQAQAAQAEAQVGVQRAEAAIAQAEAGVAQAQAAVDAAQRALDDRTLSAPFDGLVADLIVDLGEVVNPGVPAAVVADLSGWQVETTDLTELDVVAVAVGMPVEVRADALPDDVFTGVVTDIATVSQEVRGDITYKVTIALDDAADGRLRWGMTVFATVNTEQQ